MLSSYGQRFLRACQRTATQKEVHALKIFLSKEHRGEEHIQTANEYVTQNPTTTTTRPHTKLDSLLVHGCASFPCLPRHNERLTTGKQYQHEITKLPKYMRTHDVNRNARKRIFFACVYVHTQAVQNTIYFREPFVKASVRTVLFVESSCTPAPLPLGSGTVLSLLALFVPPYHQREPQTWLFTPYHSSSTVLRITFNPISHVSRRSPLKSFTEFEW